MNKIYPPAMTENEKRFIGLIRKLKSEKQLDDLLFYGEALLQADRTPKPSRERFIRHWKDGYSDLSEVEFLALMIGWGLNEAEEHLNYRRALRGEI